METYMKECDICMTSKVVRHKPYGDLQLLPVPIHCWKNLSINFVTGLLVSINWKGKTYNSILVIVNRLIASQSQNWYSWTYKSYCWCGSKTSRLAQLNYQQSRLSFHLPVQVFALLFPRHKAETVYPFPPLDKRSDRKAKQHYWSLSPSLY